MSWLVNTPIWLVGVLILSALIVAVTLGYLGQRWLHRTVEPAAETSQGSSHLLNAVLGLLGLLLAFSFSMAMDRYETRRDLVVQEANAIGTTWLRVRLLDEPDRAAMSDLLRQYLDARLLWSEKEANGTVEARIEGLQQQLWAAMGPALRSESPPLLSRGVMDSLNESIDLAAARKAARAAHIPNAVIDVLLVYAFLSMVMMGATLGTTLKLYRTQTGLLLVLLTLGHVVILDLDRPRTGAIQVSQQPLEDLSRSLR